MMMMTLIRWIERYTSYLESQLDGIRNAYKILHLQSNVSAQLFGLEELSDMLGRSSECALGPGLTVTIRACLTIGPPRPAKLVPNRNPLSHLTSKSLRNERMDLRYLENLRDIGFNYGFDHVLSTPMISLIHGWMGKIMSGSGTFEDAFGLRILLEAQRSYVSAAMSRPRLERKNPRHRVLHFAKEAFVSVSAVVESPWMERCDCSSPKRLRHHWEGLAEFMKSGRYDSLTQNPLIAGCTMVALMQVTHELGTSFMRYSQHVPGMLHIYSIVHQHKKCAPVPVLENLCSILKKPVFLGERPLKNFSTCFVRYLGGKLSFAAKRNGTSYRYGSNEKWQMTLPDNLFLHAGKCRIETNFKRFDDGVDAGLFWTSPDNADLECGGLRRDNAKISFWLRVLARSPELSKLQLPRNIVDVDDWLTKRMKSFGSPWRLLESVLLEEFGCKQIDSGKDKLVSTSNELDIAKEPIESQTQKSYGSEGLDSQAPCSAPKKQGRIALTELPIANINWLAIWTEIVKLVQEVRVDLFKDSNPTLDPYDFVLMVTDFVEAADHVCKNRGCRCVKEVFGKDSEAWGLAFDKLAKLPLDKFVWQAI